VPAPSDAERFRGLIEVHLDAAYNLARWLVRNPPDAEDLVQDAALRAWKSFGGWRGENPRAWFLAIVRNTCYTHLSSRRLRDTAPFDEALHTPETESPQQEQMLLRQADAGMLRDALAELPLEFREALVLRELEGMAYKEIAEVAGVPMGTVMSRLSRGRQMLQQKLLKPGAPR